MVNRFKEFLVSPFRSEGGLNRPLILVFLVINGIVLFNSACHDAGRGYDAAAHRRYIWALSEFRLPTEEDTHLFYTPPLPYALPALLFALGRFDIMSVAKFAQFLNLLYSVGATFYLIKICHIIRPNSPRLKFTSLLMLGLLPVYYKTFAFVRGEPLLALLSVLAVHQALAISRRKSRRVGDVAMLGAFLGLLLLTRQLGILVACALVLFIGLYVVRRMQELSFSLKEAVLILAIASITGGWFYLHLQREHGTVSAYNRPRGSTLSFSNQPREFYFGLGLDEVFRNPIRPAFRNQLLPVLYSETWGDYLCYFVVYGKDTRDGSFVSHLCRRLSEGDLPWWLQTNGYEVGRYLGRVNLVSLLPSAVFLAGVVVGLMYLGRALWLRSPVDRDLTYSLLCLVVAVSMLGFFLYLIIYANPTGNNIKPAYVLHVFPFVAILAGRFLQLVRNRSKVAYRVMLGILVLSFLHNLPVMLTRFNTCL